MSTAKAAPSGKPTATTETTTPLGVAIARMMKAIASLPIDLQDFAGRYGKPVLNSYSTWFYKNQTCSSISADANYRPRNCRYQAPLIVPEEIKESEEFIALEERQAAYVLNSQLGLGGFAVEATKLTVKYLRMVYQAHYVRFIHNMGVVMGAELTVQNYTPE